MKKFSFEKIFICLVLIIIGITAFLLNYDPELQMKDRIDKIEKNNNFIHGKLHKDALPVIITTYSGKKDKKTGKKILYVHNITKKICYYAYEANELKWHYRFPHGNMMHDLKVQLGSEYILKQCPECEGTEEHWVITDSDFFMNTYIHNSNCKLYGKTPKGKLGTYTRFNPKYMPPECSVKIYNCPKCGGYIEKNMEIANIVDLVVIKYLSHILKRDSICAATVQLYANEKLRPYISKISIMKYLPNYNKNFNKMKEREEELQ